MKKFFLLAVALIATISMNAEYVHVNRTGFNEAEATAATVGTVVAATTGGNVTIPFDDTWKVVNIKHEEYGYFYAAALNDAVDTALNTDTLGLQGQNNGKDADGGNPATTLSVYTSGAAYRFIATQDGYLTVLFKGFSNKQYVVFEEGEAIGYEYAQLVKVGDAPEVISFTIEGNDSYNHVTTSIAKVQEIVPFTANGDTILSKNGEAAMRFPVYAGAIYLFGATGTKMPLLGVYFSTTPDKISVAKAGGADKLVLLEADSISDDATDDSNPVSEETVNVVYNGNSGIDQANCTATLNDGTVLGFLEKYSNVWYFVGAITSRDSLYVPDSVICNSQTDPVEKIGDYYRVDFSAAPNLTKLSLPKTLTYIEASLPSQITDLYLNSTTPPSLYNSSSIPRTTNIWVPQEAYNSYLALTNNNNSYWYNKEVDYVGHEYQSLTLTINVAGTLANALLDSVTHWSDVNELTIIGHLNSDDMKMFARLTSLKKLDLSQTDITTISNCNSLKKLTTILLPSTLTEIGQSAFSGCYRLNNINCPNVTTIGSSAFFGCSSLTEISLPMVETIGSDAFYGCSSLTSISLPMAETIGSDAFRYCSSLSTISLPMVETIGHRAFQDCSSLTSVTLPMAKTIGEDGFKYCSALASISLPMVKTIGWYTFGDCFSLTTISLPMVETISQNVFEHCSSLTSISLPMAKTIGNNAFQYCSSLTSISLPMAKTIDYEAFYGCSSLTSISLPMAEYIGSGAFTHSLTDVYCGAVAPFSTYAFPASVVGGATLHVPAISVTSYMLHDDWYHFSSIVPMDGELSVLALNSDFSLNSTTGLADSIEMRLSVASSSQAAHVNVNVPMTIGKYEQNASTKYESSYYYDENDNYVSYRCYPYFTTLIPQAAMSADSVTINLTVPTGQWQFISFPFDVNVSDIEVPENVLWVIRKYSGADRAAMTGNTWQNMSAGSVLNAGEGYILHCTDNNSDSWRTSYITFTFKAVNNAQKNNIFAYQAVSKPLNEYASEYAHNRSWNLVGNPYPAYYSTSSMSFGAPITVWNGNGYTAYSLLDDNYVLRPFEAFFVQRPADATAITFQPEGRAHSGSISYSSDDYYYAPRREAAQSDRYVYNFTLTGNDYTDKARLVINESAQMEYEISCDASKMMSSNTTVPQLFVLENGTRMAIDERPYANGTATLGIYIGQSGTYTLSLQSNPTTEPVMLTDTKTNTVVDLSLGDYTFEGEVGTEDSRFLIGVQYVPSETTAIENVVVESDEYDVYTIDGRLLMHGSSAEIGQQLGAGMYILRSQDSVKKVMVK